MKFMVMHKHAKSTEVGTMPPQQLIERMGALVGGMAQSGRLLDGDGLGATKNRSRVSLRDQKVTVEHGPYTPGTQELPANIVKISVRSRDEAIRHATKMGQAIGGDVELEVSLINEAWDLGFGEKPADAPERYLVIHKANPKTEAGQSPNLNEVTREAKAAGALLGTIALTPSSKATRLQWKRSARTIVDGPFAETKELIGGYAVLEMASLEECIAFSTEYAQILLLDADTLEIDIRPLGGAGDDDRANSRP
ncbi:MAG: YciI family protein [Myxococcota bacterium]